MERNVLVGLGVIVVLLIGAIFVSAGTSESAEIESDAPTTCGGESGCGKGGDCGCGGVCKVKTCGCGK